MSIAAEDIRICAYYEFGVGMVRDDVTELSYVAVIVGKPKVAKPDPKPPTNVLPPEPSTPPSQQQPKQEEVAGPPPQPKASGVVDFWGCIEEQWCHVTGEPVPTGDGWVWGEFLQR